MFLTFCYILLSWRTVLLSNEAPIFSERRLLVLLVGAGLFWLALKRLDSTERVTLARTASWIVAGTAVVLSARLLVDWLMPADPLTFSYAVRWSLAWGGYFGMWVMGAVSFRQRQERQAARVEAMNAVLQSSRSSEDDLKWLTRELSAELAGLDPAVRNQLAERLMASAGCYELADEGEPQRDEHNARVRLANRTAEHIRSL